MRFLIVCGAIGFATAASAQENVFPRMVGKWREMNTATTVVIEPDGTVFANGSHIYGQVQRTITSGGNFAFENDKAQCVYDIALLQEDTTASWGFRSETIHDSAVEKGFCPRNGYFVRIETPAESDRRKLESARKERERLARIEAEQIEALRIERERQARLEAARLEVLRLERERQAKIEADRLEAQRLERERLARLEAERVERERRAEVARKEAEQRRYVQVAGECDRLAAAPDDKDKPADVPGVPWRELKLQAKEAAKACGAALKIFIDHPRLIFQMARALQHVDGARALKLHGEAAWKHGYPAAYDNLGVMYRDGVHIAQDIPKAMALFRKGAELGDAGAMYNLAYMMLREPENQDSGLQWLKKSAGLGYEPSVKLLAEYEARFAAYRERQQQPQGRYQQQPVYQQGYQNGALTPEAQAMMQIFGGVLRGIGR
jgi:TPR repeat protein